MRSIDPATGEPIRDYPEHSAAEVEGRLSAAVEAFRAWRLASFRERSGPLEAAARVLRERRDALAALMTAEMGKPIAQAEAEVEKCAWACEHFARNAERDLAPEAIPTDASLSYVRCEPLGVLLAIMPWNFPLWQVFRAAAPALMAGNAVVLKHASNVPGCSLAIEEVWRAAGLPEGLFASLLIPGAAAEALAGHGAIAAVTLTGSEAAGSAVAARAGAALRKVVLELGGSDPFLVLADCDPEVAAEAAVSARLVNNGESCIAAKRFLVEEPIAERFETALAKRLEALVVGDPRDRRTQLGPLARADLVEELDSQVRRSVAAGARLLTGGTRRPGRGFFYAPTALAGVEPGMAAFDEETFGPLAAITRARDEEHAVALANQSRYGLGASVWTGDARRGEDLALRLEAGSVFVNGMVKSDPRLPFGGIKRSGHGRELSAAGIREFVNLKTVWIR